MSTTATKVIFAPDLIGQALVDARAEEVLRLWRDSQIRPVVNRSLLIRYLRLLRLLRLSEPLIKRWAQWFTCAEQTEYRTDDSPPAPSACALCAQLARETGTAWIVHGGSVPGSRLADLSSSGPAVWVTAAEFLRACESLTQSPQDTPEPL